MAHPLKKYACAVRDALWKDESLERPTYQWVLRRVEKHVKACREGSAGIDVVVARLIEKIRVDARPAGAQPTTCIKAANCKVSKGQRHEPGCPWYGRHRSGPGGKTLSPQVQVSKNRIEKIRGMFGVREDATPNEVLDGVIVSKGGP